MLHGLSFLLVATVLLWAPGSSASPNEISWSAQKHLVNSVYSGGRRQIMEAEISPVCRHMALAALAKGADADSKKTCESATEKLESAADVFLALWTSLGGLGDDVNTVINGIPMCMSQYKSYNIPGKASCFFTKFWPIFNAIKDFWNYSDFWMKPYQAVKDFATCMGYLHSVSTANVKMIVNNAKFCN